MTQVENIFQLMRLVSGQDTWKKFDQDFNNCTIRYGDMKKQLAEDMVKFIAPIREKAEAIYHDELSLQLAVSDGRRRSPSVLERHCCSTNTRWLECRPRKRCAKMQIKII